ncbi:hypothetical protein [Breznakiella homolactica]|uniref:Uncharacterized protein n=1 Tax=Breznakiella homolactica TaxID=2798577 RepID=A0A7T7XLJ8_9SPIR|nr:hypothetical protein [Breznakiella homolactica]QQO08596.1 hypothetical protein JFL75_16925 [Breznakiella homolactica]
MCWYCGSPVTDPEPIGRSLRCADCGKDLRCCRNCRFYISGGGCSESHGEIPQDKDRANFCDWFSLSPALRSAGTGEKAARDAASSAKTAFEDLFK